MFQSLVRIVAGVMALCIGHCIYGQRVMPFPEYPQAKGVSAPFAGFIGDRLVVAGGCNFPDVPAADGGKKMFYDTVYSVDVLSQDIQWRFLSKLPFPVAYGATAATEAGLICIGGQNENGALNDVFLLKSDGKIMNLPSLPVSLDNGGAAVCGTMIFVTGGNQSDGGKGLYALDLSLPTAWRRLPDYPGHLRIQPVVLASSNALFLVGGYAFDAAKKHCLLATDILKYDINVGVWSKTVELVPEKDGSRRCMVGGSGVVMDSCLVFTGGVNYSVFKQALEGNAPEDYMKKAIEWYQFNDDILIYNWIDNNWKVIADVSGMARAGGVLLVHDNILYMVCGELKPGIRSSSITRYSLMDLVNKSDS